MPTWAGANGCHILYKPGTCNPDTPRVILTSFFYSRCLSLDIYPAHKLSEIEKVRYLCIANFNAWILRYPSFRVIELLSVDAPRTDMLSQ